MDVFDGFALAAGNPTAPAGTPSPGGGKADEASWDKITGEMMKFTK